MFICCRSRWVYASLGMGLLAVLPAVIFLARKRKADLEHIPEEKGDIDPAANAITVYFGSQTGTAEGFAKIIATEGHRHGFQVSVVDLQDFNPEELLKKKAIFLISTYGDGDPTDNAVAFSNWVENGSGEILSNYLASLEFTVFGLGNRQYEQFNVMGKKTDKGLERLGAQRMFEFGEGDDDADIEADFEAWRANMWIVLVTRFGGKDDIQGVEKIASVPFSVRMLDAEDVAKVAPTEETAAASSSSFYWHGHNVFVAVNRELRANVPGVGSTRHIEIDLDGSGVSYQTADNLAVLPQNDAVIAETLCTHLGYKPDAIFTIDHSIDHKPVFPTPCTVRDAFLRFMDIMSIPRRSLLEQLTPYVVDDSERKWMHRISSKDGREEYSHEVEDAGRTLAGLILETFPSISITLDHFLHIVPHMHPRYYTISSSSSVFPSRVHITVALLEQEKAQGNVYRGICSSFLSKLQPTDGVANGEANNNIRPQCRVFVRGSTFRLPKDTTIPIVMIGPGTGVAPMRALLQERAWQKSQGFEVGRSVLYFGCRDRSCDYIYEDELEAFKADGTLDMLRLAFSRESVSKVYVQDLLREDAVQVWGLIRGGAYMYVCGGTRMGTDVQTELTRIAQEVGSITIEKSKEFIKMLHCSGRYVQELWS